MARMEYNFAPPEYFALTVFGISMLATIGDGTPLKNIIAGAFGVLLATVGKDLLTTVERFTFGFNELSEGIGFLPVMIGIFGISELLVQAERLSVERRQVSMKAIKLPTREEYGRVWKTILRSSGYSVVPLAIGLILGGMLEKRLGQSLIMLDDQRWLMFARPLTLLFLVLTILALFGPLFWRRLFKQRDPMVSTRE
ncbi:tripartite tricarboxylate transporter permease [Pelagibius litoralis]|uniref:tripartite tricarboxylate transporter permease n=1 Tax=Pelagibius litoralis TaxID=374515 RepID=UPI00197CF0CE|nr:tripartite tricarboxylate transporter permease [Pelagibius litoralis]